MYRTLTALAVASVFAGSAMAADVTVYGIMDTGVQFLHTNPSEGASTHSFSMKNGGHFGNRFGFKGAEDLGNGYTVGFILESGFTGDDGKMGMGNRLFGREARLYVKGPAGEFSMGRMGKLTAGMSSVSLAGRTGAFIAAWGDIKTAAALTYLVGHVPTSGDNMLHYKSPTMAGWNLHAQYSGNLDGNVKDTVENKSSGNRYGALAATYANGPLNFMAIAERYGFSNVDAQTDDGTTLLGTVSYKFDAAKLYLTAQYFDKIRAFAGGFAKNDLKTGDVADGYALLASADVPMAGGTFKVGFGYTDAETEDNVDISRIGASVGYLYPFSKRTHVYAIGSWSEVERDDANRCAKTETLGANVGIVHRF